MLFSMRDQKSIKRAKRMRSEPTSAEAQLWAILRSRRYAAVKFRRQHAIGPYVVDFACVAARLVIEVDGPSHNDPEQAAFDAARTAFLERASWRVARIPNDWVFAGGDAIYLFLDSLFQD
jgi:very-short-patch-repair endonuclease